MKKKVLAVILALTIACTFTLTGCLPGTPGGSQKTPQFEASIAKVFTVGSYGGKKLLVVNLNVKNNSDYNLTSTSVQFSAQASLNGSVLGTGYLSEDSPEALPWSTTITPGAEELSQMVFELPSTEGVVNLTITVDTLDYTDKVVVLDESFDLAGVEAVVSESEFDVKVTNAIVTDDGEGTDLLVLYVSFTNNSSNAISFGYAIGTKLFQNNIALKTSYLPYKHPLVDNDLSSNAYTDIKTGATIELMLVYSLHDAKNPVEIELTDNKSSDYAVILEKTIDIAGSGS